MLGSLRRYRWWVVGVLGLALASGVVLALTTPWERSVPPSRAREYLDFQACLLTGADGLTDPDARPLWEGMQEASEATRARVSYLAVEGEQSAGNAGPYLNALLQRQCDIVLAAGPAQSVAVTESAGNRTDMRFVVVGDAEGLPSNVTALDDGTPEELKTQTAELVEEIVGN